MDTLTLNSKGQITIPAVLRRELGLKPGSAVKIYKDPKTNNLTITKSASILDAVNLFPKSKITATIEEMDEAIAEAAVERYLRSK